MIRASTFMPARPNFADCRCPSCGKLLFRVRGDSRRAFLDAKCPRCGSIALLSVGTTACNA